jgi:nitrilase
MKTLSIAALQMASLPLEKAKLDYYLSIAKSKKAKVVVLGEYVSNLFFKELEKTPKAFIVEQSQKQAANFANLAKIYNLTIIAPLIIEHKDELYKTISIFTPLKREVYFQQIFMPYPHWNERKFFANEQDIKQTSPKIIIVDGFRLAIMSGFEAHFDSFWQAKADVAIVPSVGTFDSKPRWRELLRMRAFTHNRYVLRVNRIGEYAQPKGNVWKFYGDSFCIDPYGDVEMELGDEEEMFIFEASKKTLAEARKLWRFESLALGTPPK